MKGLGLGKILDAIPISERPPSVEVRAVTVHWECDLIIGSDNSQIANLVEHQTRHVILIKVDKKLDNIDWGTDQTVTKIARRIGQIPRLELWL